jgi:hypothetical protein
LDINRALRLPGRHGNCRTAAAVPPYGSQPDHFIADWRAKNHFTGAFYSVSAQKYIMF